MESSLGASKLVKSTKNMDGISNLKKNPGMLNPLESLSQPFY